MEISEILAAYGAYYLKNGQNLKRILNMPFQGEVFSQHSTLIKTDETIYQLAEAKINSIVQAFQKDWTPKNAAAFVPNEIRQYHFKVDETIDPDDVEATWLGFLSSEDLKRSEWPLIKYLVETMYMPKIQSDMELLEYFKGVYVPPTPGLAGDTGKSMNGLGYLLRKGVNDGTMNSINIGVLTADTIFDQVEAFADGINELFQGVPMKIVMDPKWHRAYMRDKRAQGFFTLDNSSKIKSDVDFTPFEVVNLPGMVGTNQIFATPKSNLIHLTKKSQNKTRVHIEESKRSVFFMADWWEGAGFGMNGCVWSNLLPQGSGSGSAS